MPPEAIIIPGEIRGLDRDDQEEEESHGITSACQMNLSSSVDDQRSEISTIQDVVIDSAELPDEESCEVEERCDSIEPQVDEVVTDVSTSVVSSEDNVPVPDGCLMVASQPVWMRSGEFDLGKK